jgi:hypothetical protein
LLISYTNHALDQFLLEITKRVPGLKEKDVVRLGSESSRLRVDAFGQFCSLDISMVPNPDPKQLKSKPSLQDVECKYSGCSMFMDKETNCSPKGNLGPPGTGKTVVGLKIAELLLNNIHIWRNENEEKDGPFLLISYTNHALDQFLYS